MRYRHEYVEFKISKRTLHVGNDAYPLAAVARVATRDLTPERGPVVTAFLKQLGTTVAIAVGGALLLSCLGGSAPDHSGLVLGLVIAGMLVVHVARLWQGFARQRLHALVVETMRPQMALVSRDGDLIHRLRDRVIEAIDNPALEFAMQVENVVLGDRFDGDKILGDQNNTFH